VISLVAILLVTVGGEAFVWTTVLGIVIILALLIAPLTIEVDADHIHVRLAWLWHRDIPLANVNAVEAREYRALRQFGGWGWRVGRDGSRAYTMTGNAAAVVTLRDGREIYLGARNTNALAEQIGERV
jgi:hypothetical protein